MECVISLFVGFKGVSRVRGRGGGVQVHESSAWDSILGTDRSNNEQTRHGARSPSLACGRVVAINLMHARSLIWDYNSAHPHNEHSKRGLAGGGGDGGGIRSVARSGASSPAPGHILNESMPLAGRAAQRPRLRTIQPSFSRRVQSARSASRQINGPHPTATL